MKNIFIVQFLHDKHRNHVILKGAPFNKKISYFEWLDRVEETYI